MSQIHLLSDQLINQIAAGEVIERPASILKELLENSIDANATEIETYVTEGGISQIRVLDNGQGIEKEDLPLALTRHATSKIYAIHDIENLTGYGFRGEALASIASVATVSITSRHGNAPHAWKIQNQGKNANEVMPAAFNKGCQVEVGNLYFNVPARRKFLKSTSTEQAHCLAIWQRIALAAPSIKMRFQSERKKINCPTQGLPERIEHLLGKNFLNSCHEINETSGDYRLSGFYQLPTYTTGSQTPEQFLFLNGRYVKNHVLLHAIKSAYSDVLHNQHRTGFVLFLEAPPNSIDVNVHPTKIDVRFRNSQNIHQFIAHSLSKALSKNLSVANHYSSRTSAQPQNFYHSTSGSSLYPKQAAKSSSLLYSRNSSYYQNSESRPLVQNSHPDLLSKIRPDMSNQAEPESNKDQTKHGETLTENSLGYAIAQLHGIYILAQNKQGLIIIDMHAAHERVLYEKIKAVHNHRHALQQKLLIPIKESANVIEINTLKEGKSQHALSSVGFDIGVKNENQFQINAVPIWLSQDLCCHFVHELLSEISELETTQAYTEKRNEVLANIACRSAIKANQAMSVLQMNALLREIEKTDNASYCNHGRPTYLSISIEELDHLFMRGR